MASAVTVDVELRHVLDMFDVSINPYASMEAYKNAIQWSAVITRSDIVRYYMNNYKKCVRISTRLWIHKRHPIPRPSGRVMGCPLRIFWENGPRYNGTALYLNWCVYVQYIARYGYVHDAATELKTGPISKIVYLIVKIIPILLLVQLVTISVRNHSQTTIKT